MLSIFGGRITVQTFADSRGCFVKPEVRHGLLRDLRPWAERVNRAGAGVFVSVNEMSGWRDAAHVVRVRSFFCDIDGVCDEGHKAQRAYELLTCELPPSAIVKSANGLHAYWYVFDGEPVDAERFKRIEMGIIQAFRGCSRTKDIARVLRLPSFFHMKNPELPYLVEVLYEDASIRYSGDVLAEAFPFREPVRRVSGGARVVPASDVWGAVLDSLRGWTPVDGSKHTVVMLALGVAKKFGVSESDAVAGLLPIVSGWDVRSDPVSTLRRNARWAFSQGGECSVAGLRSLGVPVPNLRRIAA